MRFADSAASDEALPPAAGTVLYRPDPGLLAHLLAVLSEDGCPLFVHLNGPVSVEVEALLADVPRARITRSEVNAGLGHGLNAIAAAARAEGHPAILLLDQDSTPAPGMPARLASAFRAITMRGHRLAAVGPRLVVPEGTSFLPMPYHRRVQRSGGPDGAVHFLPTSGSLVSLEAWHQIGPFRDDYFIGGIDVEWGARAWQNGWASVLVDEIEMVHRWGEENDSGRPWHPQILRQSPARLFYYVRNAVHGMTLPHMPVRWKAWQALRLVSQVVLAAVARRDISPLVLLGAVRDGWSGRLGPAPPTLAPEADRSDASR